MKTFFSSFLFAAALACAQPALAPPHVGFVQDASQALRPVLGIAGNFLLGDAIASGIVASAFSGSYGIYTTSSALVVTDRDGKVMTSQAVPAGPAIFAFARNGRPALAYFPTVNLLLSWTGDSFQLVSFAWSAFPRGSVRSINSPDPDHAAFLVQGRGDLTDIRLLLKTGAVDSRETLPGVKSPALMLATGELIYRDSEGIVVRRPDRTEFRLSAQLPRHLAFRQMGAGWVEIQDVQSPTRMALRVTAGQESIFVLPEEEQ